MATRIFPTGSATNIMSTVIGQVKADLPVLLVILAGIWGIISVIRLLRSFMHPQTDSRRRDFIEGTGEFSWMQSDGLVDIQRDAALADHDAADSWASFVDSNERTIASADAAIAENDQIMRSM